MSTPHSQQAPTTGTPSVADRSGGDKEFMATLAKGLTVLGAFGEQRPTMTLSEAAETSGLTRCFGSTRARMV